MVEESCSASESSNELFSIWEWAWDSTITVVELLDKELEEVDGNWSSSRWISIYFSLINKRIEFGRNCLSPYIIE
jgi:hypothetical protein